MVSRSELSKLNPLGKKQRQQSSTRRGWSDKRRVPSPPSAAEAPSRQSNLAGFSLTWLTADPLVGLHLSNSPSGGVNASPWFMKRQCELEMKAPEVGQKRNMGLNSAVMCRIISRHLLWLREHLVICAALCSKMRCQCFMLSLCVALLIEGLSAGMFCALMWMGPSRGQGAQAVAGGVRGW